MKASKLVQQVFLLLISIIFSVALMFSFVELPRLLDVFIQSNIDFPGLDQGRDGLNAFKSELYISSLYLRWIGYGSLVLVALFIILGFTTRKSSWAWAGAFVIFLPVFGQFAMSMFFLAGLGMLRVGWLPFTDISFQVLDLGNVIYIPYWILMWIFEQFDYWAQLELGWFFMGLGAFLFTWGVLIWMQSRFGRQGVASSWIYRISRHPQYLGWIIWTYGLIIYTPLINNMKRSWGIGSSLPWLLMTMIIIGICMMEELHMKKKYGHQYDEYRNKAPFLLPLPGIVKRVVKFPMWLIIRKRRPERNSEVAWIITVYTVILMFISLFWVDFGQKKLFPLREAKRIAVIEQVVEDIKSTENWRIRDHKFWELLSYGDLAHKPILAFLEDQNPENQRHAAKLSGIIGDTSAIRPLRKLLSHPWEDVKVNSMRSLIALKDTMILDLLIDRLHYETASYPLSVIYESFGVLQAQQCWKYLVYGYQACDKWTQLAIVKSMARIYPDSTAVYLIPLLQDEQLYLVSDALAVAIQIKDKSTLPYLQDILDTDNYEITFLAREAIKAIKEDL